MANTQINIVTNGTTTLATSGKYCDRNIDVNVAVPASGITPTGSINITANGTHNVANYANAVVNVPTGITPSGTKSITENGTHDVTNYANAIVNVPTAQPTQFTNLYDPANVTIGQYIHHSSGTPTYTTEGTSNILKIPYNHAANTDVVLRLRGLGTIRDRTTVVTFKSDGVTKVAHYTISDSIFGVSYDEHGDVAITLKSGLKTTEWGYLVLNVQYPLINKATTALSGPIVTINEPIGNGGSVG